MNNTIDSGPIGVPRDAEPGATTAGTYYSAEDEGAAAPAEAGGIDIRALWSLIYRNRLIIAAVLLVALLAGLAATLLTTPIYEATASVQIDQKTDNVLNTEDVSSAAPIQDTQRFLETQLEVIRSRTLAARVAQNLGLYNGTKFLIAMKATPAAKFEGSATASDAHRQQVIGVLVANLRVEMPRTSRVADLSFRSPDRSLAARVANAYARAYIDTNLERRFDSSAYARNFLEQQIAQTKQKLEQSERDMIGYARNAQLIDTSAGAAATPGTAESSSGSLTTANLVQLNSAYSDARTKRIQAEQRWQQSQATPIMALPEVLANVAVQTLLQTRADKRATYEELKQRYRPDHPLMVQAAAEIAELDRQIATQASNIRQSIKSDFDVARQQEQSLESNVTALTSDTLNEQDRRIRYNILKREADTNRTLYDGLLQRYKEISAAAGLTNNNVSIVDDARVPSRPILPKPFNNLLIALALGMVVAAGLVFVRENFDDVIRTPDEVQRKLSLPFLGGIPLVKQGSTTDEALQDPRSAVSEAYYALRTSLEFATPRGAPRSLLFTSSQPAEGKSTSAVATAQGFARIGRKVLLIDGDLRKPSLHNILGLSTQSGLANLLTAQQTVAQVAQPTATPGLDFVACGPLPPNPAELLSSPALPRVLHAALETYDLVVIDGPPVMGLADAQLLARQARATVFVIEANRAHRGQAKAAIRRLLAGRASLVGVVLTKFDARRVGYGYGYGSYGYSYYDYGSAHKETTDA